MYLTHDEGKSVMAERFINTLNAKFYNKMTANDKKSYLSYLNKLADQYNNTYHHSTNKKTINADYSALTKKLRQILNLLSLKLMIQSKLLRIRKGYTENWSREIFLINSVLKTNPWICKMKDLNRKKIINFYEKELLLSILQMTYYPKPDRHIRDKVKVV